jgi:hypothetical protein
MLTATLMPWSMITKPEEAELATMGLLLDQFQGPLEATVNLLLLSRFPDAVSRQSTEGLAVCRRRP